MKKPRFSEERIVHALEQVEGGVPIAKICRKYCITEQTDYRWRKKYDKLSASELRRLGQREEENRKLEQPAADLTLDKTILLDVLPRKLSSPHADACWLATPTRPTTSASSKRAGCSSLPERVCATRGPRRIRRP